MVNVAYKHVLFDYDGCLGNTLGAWTWAIRRCSEKFGMNLNVAQINEQMRWGLRKVRGQGLGEMQVLPYYDMVREIAKTPVFAAKLHDGAKELLLDLSAAGKGLAVVSTNILELRELLAKDDILHLFRAVVTNRDVKNNKPHPEGIEFALRILRGNKADAVMVGDTGNDLAAARNAGIDFILFHPGGAPLLYEPAELVAHPPKHIVESHYELRELLIKGLSP